MNERANARSVILVAAIAGLALAVLCGAQTTFAAASGQSPMLLAQAGGAEGSASAGAEAKAPCDAPREYVKLINAGQYGDVGGLFADDAVYMGPDGKTRHGSKEIGGFYKKFLSVYKPQVRGVSFIQQGSECMMELENKSKKSGKYELVAVDHFTVNPEGKVSKFIVYVRPGSRVQSEVNSALAKVH